MIARYLDTQNESDKAQFIRSDLKSMIVGQQEAIDATVEVMERYHSGLLHEDRPIGSLLFLGPTGAGKTRLVEAVAESLFCNPRAVVKIDCGEFQQSHEIAKLIGSPPGYLGHRETPPRLTQKTLEASHSTKYPISLILFDEIEKASDALWHLLLGVLDKATLTLGDNTTTNFSKSIIFMTSNAGSQEMNYAIGNRIGIQQARNVVNEPELKKIALEAAKRKFTTEFINRLDKIVAFHSLSREQILEVADIELGRLQENIIMKAETQFYIKVTPEAKAALVEEGYDPKRNGRGIRATIERRLSLPLAKAVSTKQLKLYDRVLIDTRNGKFTFGVEA